MTTEAAEPSDMSDGASPETASADLAFLRGLVDDGGAALRGGGVAMLAAGSIFGMLALSSWLRQIDALPGGYATLSALCVLAIAAFVAVLAMTRRGRHMSALKGGAGRALSAAIAGGGLAILAIQIAVVIIALKLDDPAIQLIHPVMLSAVQGAVWFVVWRIRRRAWLGLVALGWYATALALALAWGSDQLMLIFALALFLLMALPGWVMFRLGRGEAA